MIPSIFETSARMNLFTVVLCCCVLALHAQAQPTACKDEWHCPTGFFCQTDVHFCHECIRCEDLKRRPPQDPSSCIQSFGGCGDCIDGLIEDLHGDVTAQCVEATARGQGPLPVYVWVAIVAGLLFFVIVVAIVVYALRNKELFKNVVSGETSVRSSRVCGTRLEPPPPYNDQYLPVRPSSPPAPPAPDAPAAPPAQSPPPADESSWPFMKAAPAPPRQGAREAAAAQAAMVYNNPAYVRGPYPHQPPSYDSGEESEPHTPFTVHDEETMESTWTPHENNNDNDTSSGLPPVPELTEVTTVARTDVAPPAKRPRLPQDSNNNHGSSGAGAETPSTSAAPGVTINVLVHQRNDLRL